MPGILMKNGRVLYDKRTGKILYGEPEDACCCHTLPPKGLCNFNAYDPEYPIHDAPFQTDYSFSSQIIHNLSNEHFPPPWPPWINFWGSTASGNVWFGNWVKSDQYTRTSLTPAIQVAKWIHWVIFDPREVNTVEVLIHNSLPLPSLTWSNPASWPGGIQDIRYSSGLNRRITWIMDNGNFAGLYAPVIPGLQGNCSRSTSRSMWWGIPANNFGDTPGPTCESTHEIIFQMRPGNQFDITRPVYNSLTTESQTATVTSPFFYGNSYCQVWRFAIALVVSNEHILHRPHGSTLTNFYHPGFYCSSNSQFTVDVRFR